MSNPFNVHVLLYKSSTLIEILGVYDPAAAAYLNAATVSVVLIRPDGSQVAGQTWPLACAYVGGSNGDYRGTLVNTLQVRRGETLLAQVTINGGADKVGYLEIPIRVEVQGP